MNPWPRRRVPLGDTPHYSLKWATDKFRWRAFGALPTIRAKPRGGRRSGASDGRLPLPRRGPGVLPPGALAARTTDRKLPGASATAGNGCRGEGFRSAYRLEDTTVAPIRIPEAVIGLDVGKSSHWACVATRDGEVLLSTPRREQGGRPRLAVRPLPRCARGRRPVAQHRRPRARPRRGRPGCRRRTCRDSRRTGPPGSSPATPRPTSETRWSSRRRRLASPTRSCRSETQSDDCGGEGAGRPEELPDLREH